MKCIGLLLLIITFWDSVMLLHVSADSLFLLLSFIPLYRYTTICLSIPLLMNIQVVSGYIFICIVCVCISIYRHTHIHLCTSLCVDICFNFFWINSWNGITGWYGKYMFKFMRNCHNVFQSRSNTLSSYLAMYESFRCPHPHWYLVVLSLSLRSF